MIPKNIASWIRSVVGATPPNVRLLYFEWNEGKRGSERVLWFNAFGYKRETFDPEDSSSLSTLSEWDWQAIEGCAAAVELASDTEALRRSLEDLFASDRTIVDALIKRGGQIVFGRHEGSVAVYPKLTRPQSATCYYELHCASQSNHVETSGLDEFDATEITRILEKQRFERPLPPEATFHLQPRGKERDVLRAIRYFVCNDRMRELIEAATDQCQVFPIRLYRSKKVDERKRISGYYVINLYEQLECLDPATVLPPPYRNFLPTFDPTLGYRIVQTQVGSRDIFRIAYEYRRLLVSHAFRMKCEQRGITGVEWLRRESV